MPISLIKLLRPSPRLYSIASAQSEVEEEVHLTVGVVRYRQEDGTVRSGGASSLSGRPSAGRCRGRVFVEHNDNFRLPANPDTPVIMVGPGTGIARSAPSCRSGKHRGRGQELALLRQPPLHPGLPLSGGVAALCEIGPAVEDLPAFSQDQANKIYVQDRLREAGLSSTSGWKQALTSMCVATPTTWRRMCRKPC